MSATQSYQRFVEEVVGRSYRAASIVKVHANRVDVQVGDSPRYLRGLSVIGGTDDLVAGDPILLREADGKVYAESFQARAGTRKITTAGGTGAMTDHDLDGVYHTASGLTTGHVMMATSATAFAFQAQSNIDHDSLGGVVADEHIAHSSVWLTAGGGLTGGGTIEEGRTLAVGAGDGITVNANDVAVDVTDIIDTSYGLTENANDIRVNLEANEGLEFNAGAIRVDVTDFIDTSYGLTESSNNIRINLESGGGLEFNSGALRVDEDESFSWTGTHAFSADIQLDANLDFVGAQSITTTAGNLTVAPAANLALSPAGGTTTVTGALTVTGGLSGASASFSGAVDVTGDFTVATNVLFVDVSNTNAGINCAPDPQFDLDVAGNLRAQGWIVGKHALQVPGALMVCHCDGPTPYETDFTGTAYGHMGQVPYEFATFKEGVFSKGIQIAEDTENLIIDPLITNVSNWAAVGGSIAQSSLHVKYGVYSLEVTTAASTSYDGARYVPDISVSTSTDYTVSVYVYCTTAGVPLRILVHYDVSGDQVSGSLGDSVVGWQKLVFTSTSGGSDSLIERIAITNHNDSTIHTFYISALQCEEQSYATPTCTGDMGQGHAWTGTEDDSTSTRTAQMLRFNDYAADLFRPAGSVFGWIVIDTIPSDTGGTHSVIDFCDESGGRLFLRLYSDDYFDLYVNAAYRITNVGPGSYLVGDEVFFCVTWDFDNDNYTLTIYANGTEYSGSSTASLDHFTPSIFTIGANYLYYNKLNGILDEIVVLDRVLSADEITTIIESDAPVFAETSTWMWRAGAGLVWADAEGLWGRTTDGAASIGWSGVDGKSWGNKTLDMGDFLLGRGASGASWVMWDADASDILMGSEGTTYLTMDGSTPSIAVGITTSEHVLVTSSGLQINEGATTRAELSGTVFTLGSTSTEHVRLTSSALQFRDGVTTHGELSGGTLTLGGTANEHIAITSSSIHIKDGSTLYFQLGASLLVLGRTTSGHVQITGSAVQLKEGANVYTELSGGTLTLGYTSDEYIKVSPSGIQLYDGATLYATYGATTTIGLTTSEHVAITPTAVQFKDGSTVYAELVGGVLLLGHDGGGEYVKVDSTGIEIWGGGYKAVSLDSSGNAVFGRVATNFGNMYWNNTSHQLQFRGGAGGTTVHAYVDTDGTIAWGSGAGKLTSTGAQIDAGEDNENSIRWLDGAAEVAYARGYVTSGHHYMSVTTTAPSTSYMSAVEIRSEPYTGVKSAAIWVRSGDATNDGYIYLATNGTTKIQVKANYVQIGRLFIGTSDADPGATGRAIFTEDIRVGGGVYVGGIGTDPDPNDVYVVDNVSADSFTDRTPMFVGNALDQISHISARQDGQIDHSSLPPFARKTVHVVRDGQDVYEEGRNLGAMISVLTVGVQELLVRVEALEAAYASQ